MIFRLSHKFFTTDSLKDRLSPKDWRHKKYCRKSIFLFVMISLIFQQQLVPQEKIADRDDSTSVVYVFDSLIKSGISIMYTNPEKTRSLILEALSLNDLNDTSRLIKALNVVGATYQLQASYSNAMEYYYKGLQLATMKNNELLIGHMYNNLGSAHLKLGNHKDALDYYLKAQNIYTHLEQPRNSASAHNNIGLLYMELNNFENALQHFNEAVKLRPLTDSIGSAATLSNIGSVYLQMGMRDSAFYYHNKSIAMDIKTDNKFGLTVGYQGIAEAYQETGELEKAIENYLLSKKTAKMIDHFYQVAMADLGLSKIYLLMKKYDDALQFADSAVQISLTLNNSKLKQETQEIISQIYEQTGHYKKAFENYRSSVSLRDSMINQSKLHQIYNLEIEQLNMAGEIQKLEIQRQELLLSKKNNIIIFIVVAFVLTLAGIYLLYLNFNHRRKANLQKTILSLTEKKSRAATEAEIQERKRIGQDLHDGLGQMLSVARLNISVLQQKPVLTDKRKKELLDAALHSVDDAFYELRNISHNLAPSMLSSKGFSNAVREMVDQVNQSRHIQVHLGMYGLNGQLDSILENTFYRAAQELLSNTIKHSKANNLDLQIIKSENEITLMTEDDGNGFDVNKTLILNGGGLSNIRSRIENLNGNIFIDSKENWGTIITIVIPLKKTDYVSKSH